MVLTTVSGALAFWETLQTTGLPFLGAGCRHPSIRAACLDIPGDEGGVEVEATPCHPGYLCQAGGLAASLTWPLGLGDCPEDSGALGVLAGLLSFAGASGAPCAWRSLALGGPWEKPWDPASVPRDTLLCRWGCEASEAAP